MADIYNDEGTLDYAKAAALVRSGDGLSTGPIFEAKMARVQAAALLDIAVSLGAIVTGLATGGMWLDDAVDDVVDKVPGDRTVDDPDDGESERETDPDVLDLDIGDRITAEGSGGGVIKALGESEDAAWAEVEWDADEGEDGRVTRVWVSQLEREGQAEPGEGDDAAIDEEPECGVENPDSRKGCIREPGHKGAKHVDDDGNTWKTAAA